MADLPPPAYVLIGLLALLPIVPNLWAIWHAFHREFATAAEKGAWILASVFIPVLGGIVYCFWGRKRGTKVI
jgi:hypothetical protein